MCSFTDFSFVTSITAEEATPPLLAISDAVSFTANSSTSMQETLAPSLASLKHIALPIAPPAPYVTSHPFKFYQ